MIQNLVAKLLFLPLTKKTKTFYYAIKFQSFAFNFRWQQYYDIGIDNNSERSWLCHELGQCHLELNQHQQAINQGENSLEAAEAGDLKDRKVSAAVLIGQAACEFNIWNNQNMKHTTSFYCIMVLYNGFEQNKCIKLTCWFEWRDNV